MASITRFIIMIIYIFSMNRFSSFTTNTVSSLIISKSLPKISAVPCIQRNFKVISCYPSLCCYANFTLL